MRILRRCAHPTPEMGPQQPVALACNQQQEPVPAPPPLPPAPRTERPPPPHTHTLRYRQKDHKDGRYSQLTASALDTKFRDDLERLKKIRCGPCALLAAEEERGGSGLLGGTAGSACRRAVSSWTRCGGVGRGQCEQRLGRRVQRAAAARLQVAQLAQHRGRPLPPDCRLTPLPSAAPLHRNHRGLRHYWGIRVRGQHTKTTGRRGRTVGVAKKK
jgi:hypothetical protein